MTARAGALLAATYCLTAATSCGGGDEAGGSTSSRAPSATTARTVAVPSVSPGRADKLGLTRTLPVVYRRVCSEQAAYAPAGARVCPPLIPEGRLKVIDAMPLSKKRGYRGGYLSDIGSSAIGQLGGRHIETNGGHWHYDVSWAPAARRTLVHGFVERPVNATRASQCRRLSLGDERVEACRVVPYEEGGGMNGGHIAYVWDHGSASYVVSLHGYANEPRARAMTEALIAAVLHG